MTRRMLIDGVHPEQTRVVVMDDRRLLEFDTEIASQRTLKGNIYLAKVTRVEPSLQAAFVDYGGNRHGFLPFSEIHPDYYRIPVADREALKESQRRHRSRDDDDDDDDLDVVDDDDDLDVAEIEAADADDDYADDDASDESPDDDTDDDSDDDDSDDSDSDDDGSDDDGRTTGKSSQALAANVNDPTVSPGDGDSGSDAGETPPATATDAASGAAEDAGHAPSGGDSGEEERPRQRRGRRNSRNGSNGSNGSGTGRDRGGRDRNNRGGDRDDDRRSRSNRAPHRSYTIQEVLKRGQIMLIQVVKEERGTKGAAVTSYLSLAGRYCVLMPNTARGGGISRKITQGKDRKRLKDIVDSLEIQDSMAVIVRTAGIGRTKSEIKRDYDFLAKTWERIRDTTLQSRAPVLIYEESGLIKRTLRDSYTREIEEVVVQGDAAYREAKDFMKTLMPSHAKRVQPYKDASPPLFHRYNVDVQLHRLHSPIVQLPSGGYLVINLTEALVAIDINSGRSTRERNIEETALKTNLEAADEIGRHLRLRDLAGLVVIDFIDMDDRRNNFAVERRLKDAMRTDRARVQIGRISPLGLLELSRQRLRPSLLETMMDVCPVCEGLGWVASTSSSAIQALSMIEDEGMRGRSSLIRVHVASAVAFYVLNEKRDELARIERDYGLRCVFQPDASLIPPNLKIEVLETGQRVIDVTDTTEASEASEATEADVIVEPEEEEAPQPRRRGRRGRDDDQDEASDGQESGRRRRGRRSGRRRDEAETAEAETAEAAGQKPDSPDGDADDSANSGRGRGRRRRRRGRGRGEGRSGLPGVAVFARSATPLSWHVAAEEQESQPAANGHDSSAPVEAAPAPASTDAPEQPPEPEAVATGPASEETVANMLMPVAQAMDKAPSGRPRRRRRSSDQQDQAGAPEAASAQAETAVQETVPEVVAEAPALPESSVQPETSAAPEPAPAVASEPEATPVAETSGNGQTDGADETAVQPEATPVAAAEPAAQQETPAALQPEPDQPRRRRKGWWQRLLD